VTESIDLCVIKPVTKGEALFTTQETGGFARCEGRNEDILTRYVELVVRLATVRLGTQYCR